MGVSRKKYGQGVFGQCVYCGEEAELTGDHVIPQALFIPPLPANMIKVPACLRCNRIKSGTDDFLRDILVTDQHGSKHPTAQKLFDSKVLRSHLRNSSRVTRDIVSKAQLRPLYTPAGIYLGHFHTVDIDSSKLNKIFTWIIRGLYYDHRNQRIPDDYAFEVVQYAPGDFKGAWQIVQQNLNPNGPISLGDVFSCAYVAAAEDLFSTWWFLEFYGGACFAVTTEKTKTEH